MIKRINLSFDLNTNDKEVYEIISKQRYKTNFVCKAILYYINSREVDTITTKDLKATLKETILEVFQGLDNDRIISYNATSIEQNELPKEVFDIFSQL